MPPEREDPDLLDVTGAISLPFRLLDVGRRLFRRPDPVQILKRREHWRAELRANLEWPERDEAPEVMVIRMSKRNRYPEVRPRLLELGASDSLKLEVKGVTDRYLDVYSRIISAEIVGDTVREVWDHGEDAVTVMVVGSIPLERIRHIDWEPDSATGLPRIYMDYGPGGPVAETTLYAIDPTTRAHNLLYGMKYKPIRVGLFRRFRDNLRNRRPAKAHL